MNKTSFHYLLAEKFVFKQSWKDSLVGDSLLNLVRFAYSEEEAQVTSALDFMPRPAWMIARKVGRPISEVEPILKSLGDRILILRKLIKGHAVYGFLALIPGVFEFQMMRAHSDPDNHDYYKEFARLYEEVYEEYMTWIKPHVDRKDLRFMRIIPVEKSIENTIGIVPFNTDRYSEIVDRNRSFCLVNACPCRYEFELLNKGCGKPLDVCSAMGWLADLAIEKGLARRVSKEEFLEAKARATDAGLVHMTDNLRDPLQVCSCCTCCCSGLRMIKNYNIPSVIAKSNFEAVVDVEKCLLCEKCVNICPMDAILVEEKSVKIDYTRCIGCGVCVIKCDKAKAMGLRERKYYKRPSDNILEYFSQRYFECLGKEKDIIPRVSLGVGGLLSQLGSRISPFHISGPKYRPSI